MYIPSSFAQSDLGALHDFIDQYSFALLVSQFQNEPFATHLPLILNRSLGPNGTLLGHVARANPQWTVGDGQTVLAIFSGPHAYISPTWYQSERTVPTWNYVAVHVYGRFERIESEAELIELLRTMADYFESSMPQPWKVDTDADFIRKMAAQIVGFRIAIERVEGKWKLNQNQPAERQRRVIEKLQEQTDEDSQAIAALMKANLSQLQEPHV
jgi:transcriptional regulator